MKIIIVGSNSQCFGVLYNFVNNSNGLATSGLSSLIGALHLNCYQLRNKYPSLEGIVANLKLNWKGPNHLEQTYFQK